MRPTWGDRMRQKIMDGGPKAWAGYAAAVMEVEFGERLARAMKRRGLTAAMLARAAGKDPAEVARVLSGRNVTLKTMATYLAHVGLVPVLTTITPRALLRLPKKEKP